MKKLITISEDLNDETTRINIMKLTKCEYINYLSGVCKSNVIVGVMALLLTFCNTVKAVENNYPEELLNIELFTKGKIKVGDKITAENVDVVKDLLDPVAYIQVKTMGRVIDIVESTTDVTKLFPHEYLQATLKNEGKAHFDEAGNVVTESGERWIGGNPFPNAETAEEVMANLTLSWGRRDQSVYAMRDWDIGPDGNVQYQYDLVWAEMNAAGLVNSDSPYMIAKSHDDKLRYQSVFFTYPNDTKGTSFLNTWYADQNAFPDLYGYLPAFKRVRRFPSNQRFEPLVPGMTFFLSDAWASGDPMLTWGNYKIVSRGPFLGGVSKNFHGEHENWEPGVHGGPQGKTFFDTNMELLPDVMVIEAEPTGFPRAPVGKKRIYVDMRNSMYIGYVTYDRRGEIWKSFHPVYSQYIDGNQTIMDGEHPVWSWTSVMSHDIQTNRMTRFAQVKEVKGGYKSSYNMGSKIYTKYLTVQAIRRLGR